jgi:hypothetical protein
VTVEVYERTLLLATRRANEREMHPEGIEALNDHVSRSLKRSVSTVGERRDTFFRSLLVRSNDFDHHRLH